MATTAFESRGRRLTVDHTPLPTVWRSDERMLVRPVADWLLTLRSPRATHWFGLFLLLLGPLLVGTGALVLFESFVGLILAIPGLGVSAMGGVLAGRTYRFDRQTETWSRSKLVQRTSRPLNGIVAVQVCRGAWISPRSFGTSTTPRVRRRFLYQLNLVLDDPAVSGPGPGRQLVSMCSDVGELRALAATLAAFLDVPVLLSPAVEEALAARRTNPELR